MIIAIIVFLVAILSGLFIYNRIAQSKMVSEFETRNSSIINDLSTSVATREIARHKEQVCNRDYPLSQQYCQVSESRMYAVTDAAVYQNDMSTKLKKEGWRVDAAVRQPERFFSVPGGHSKTIAQTTVVRTANDNKTGEAIPEIISIIISSKIPANTNGYIDGTRIPYSDTISSEVMQEIVAGHSIVHFSTYHTYTVWP